MASRVLIRRFFHPKTSRSRSRTPGLEKLRNPRSVAIIGASRDPGKVGYAVLRNLKEAGFEGKILPINPTAESILGVRCYPSILEAPPPIDLAVVSVPAASVLKVIEECGERGVGFLVILSAGFKEIGGEGSALERTLVKLCRERGLRFVGPNCLGLIETSSRLNVSFAQRMPLKGNIAFASQSGALCTAVLDWSVEAGVGFSSFVSLGNKADLNEVDFLEDLGRDPATKVILLYLEGVAEGERFVEVAKEVTQRKPVVVLKSGVSSAGARAASSHTGSLTGSDVAFNAACREAGIIRVHTVEDLFDTGIAFATQPVPQDRSLVVLTNAGGPGILATDAIEKHGLKLSPIVVETQEVLRKRFPPYASFHNPVDILGEAKAEGYGFALGNLLRMEGVDGGLVIVAPVAMSQINETARIIAAAKAQHPEKVLLAILMGGESVREGVGLLMKEGVPCYKFPDRAARVMADLVSYKEYLQESNSHEAPVNLSVDLGAVRRIFQKVRGERRTTLLAPETRVVATAYGIPTPNGGLARSGDEAVEIAGKVGLPVALKVVSPQILHKTDIGCVRLNLKSEAEVEAAFEEILRNSRKFAPDAVVHGVEVQAMIPTGRETIVGVAKDPQFGHLIMFGLGGIYVNLLKDVTFRLPPLTRGKALRMVEETKAYTLLKGARGERPSDLGSVVSTLLKVSQLISDFPEVGEMDINPLLVHEEGRGCTALDLKITLLPPTKEV